MVQKYRNPEARRTDDAVLKNIGELDTSAEVLVLVDEAHRSHSTTLHAALRPRTRAAFRSTALSMLEP